MLKLVYNSASLGPIDLEYDRPLIRVGRNDDNDLVLRHPSINPYHCLLLFRDQSVLCLPPDQPIDSQTDLRIISGPAFGLGDSLAIGQLRFSLSHSSKTVLLPVHTQAPTAGNAASPESQPPYYCPHCRAYFHEREVKRMGLVGQPKRCLCPKCSRLLDTPPKPQGPSPNPKKRSLLSWIPGARA